MHPLTDSITEDSLVPHIKTLASDDFQGREPSSEGEQKTISYIKQEFQRLGLLPGNGDSFFQEVPLVKVESEHDAEMPVRGADQSFSLKNKDEVVANTRRLVESVSLENSDLVFAGYGIVAPEYNWNDYENFDVTGKTVIVLVNDPGYATEDPDVFNGKAMTYYGRWTYKFEEAARQGAAGILIVHETGPAGYPWDVVRNSFGGPQFYMESDEKPESFPIIQGWLTSEAAEKLLKSAGQNFSELKNKATTPDFSAVNLGLNASYSVRNSISHSKSHNVLGVLPGSEYPDEYIIYTAHWDHFGVEKSDGEIKIYNGARDNATGVAAVLDVARAYTELPEPPKRSILFMPVTAEERGLLGSEFYASNPVKPLDKTVAVINMDALNIWGPVNDITVVGYGNSELDEIVEDVAKQQNRSVRPDPEPEKGHFYRMDHFSFAKQGVPALAAEFGVDHKENGVDWMQNEIHKWTDQHYHKPSDVYDPDYWNLEGAIDDVRMYFQVGFQIADSHEFPNWREGTEFKSTRDAMMK